MSPRQSEVLIKLKPKSNSQKKVRVIKIITNQIWLKHSKSLVLMKSKPMIIKVSIGSIPLKQIKKLNLKEKDSFQVTLIFLLLNYQLF